jgi:hypothetical protein
MNHMEEELSMANPVSGVTNAPAVNEAAAAQPKQAAPAQTAAPAAKTSKLPQDTVQLSSTISTPAEEAKETQAQTVQEAARGDNQARRILAQEQAAAQVNQK